jgi:hypothetical protein
VIVLCQRLHQFLTVKSSLFSFKLALEAIVLLSLTNEEFAILAGIVYNSCKSLNSLVSLKKL